MGAQIKNPTPKVPLLPTLNLSGQQNSPTSPNSCWVTPSAPIHCFTPARYKTSTSTTTSASSRDCEPAFAPARRLPPLRRAPPPPIHHAAKSAPSPWMAYTPMSCPPPLHRGFGIPGLRFTTRDPPPARMTSHRPAWLLSSLPFSPSPFSPGVGAPSLTSLRRARAARPCTHASLCCMGTLP